MQYLKKRFSVPAPNVSQEEWDRIFGKKPVKKKTLREEKSGKTKDK